MSDDENKDAFDLSWDDALADWERDIDDSAEAKSAPMANKPPAKPPAPPARPLYQPPDPAEIARLRQRRAGVAEADSSEMTMIAALPSPERGAAPTAPPPPMESAGAPPERPSGADLDLDDLLGGFESDTRLYPGEALKVSPVKPPLPRPPAPRVAAPLAAGAKSPVKPPLPRVPIPKPGGGLAAGGQARPPAPPKGAVEPPRAPDAAQPPSKAGAAAPALDPFASLDDDLALLGGALEVPAPKAALPKLAAATPAASAAGVADDDIDAMLSDLGGPPPFDAHTAKTPIPPPLERSLASSDEPPPIALGAAERASSAEDPATTSFDDFDLEIDAMLGEPARESAEPADPAAAAPLEAEEPRSSEGAGADDDFFLLGDEEPAPPSIALDATAHEVPAGERPTAELPRPAPSTEGATERGPEVRPASGVGSIRPDRGAQAARRTVRSRKPRREVFPLVGRQPDALAARAHLLELSAESEALSASARARALLAAAELQLALGAPDAVARLVERAVALAPSDVAVLRMARAVAVARREPASIARWLEAEAALTPATDPKRRAALLASSAVVRSRAGEAARAAALAKSAFEASGGLLTSLVVLSFAPASSTAPAAREALRDRSRGPIAKDAVAGAIVAAGEGAALSDADVALLSPETALHVLATERRPELRASLFELLAGALDDEPAEAARLLELRERSAARQDDAELREAIHRLGREGTRPLAFAFALDAASAAASSDEGELSERLALTLAGAERAALLGRASLLASARGELRDAEAFARAAAAADGGLGAVRAARLRIAELDPSRRAQRVEAEGALVVAAKLAREPGGLAQEAEVLEQAVERGEGSTTAAILRLDALSALASEPRMRAALEIALRRAAGAEELAARARGLSLAGALVGDREAAAIGLDASRSLLTARASLLSAQDPAERARAFEAEASVARGAEATRASRELARSLGGSALDDAVERLARSAEGDVASSALLALYADRDAHPLARAFALAGFASSEPDPRERARSWARAAMAALAAGDGNHTRDYLARAAADAPDDVILDLMRWRDANARASAVPDDVASHRRRASEGAMGAVLELHTALVMDEQPRLARGVEGATGIAEEVVSEAARRASRLAASRSPVPVPTSLEDAGADLAKLRALERATMSSLDGLDVALALAEAVREPADRASYLREALVSALRRPPSPELEARMAALAEASERDPWLARRAMWIAVRRGDRSLARVAGLEVAEGLESPDERASEAMHASSFVDASSDERVRHETFEALRAFRVGAPTHPLLAEEVARLAALAGEHEQAGVAFEEAARDARSARRKARLYVAAADAYEESSVDPARAIAALEEASRADVTYDGVFDRLRVLLERAGDDARLAALIGRRIQAGDDASVSPSLLLAQASLLEKSNDRAGACEALRRALTHAREGSPEHLATLKRLAELLLLEEDYRGAAEALIRLAKLRREVEELRWIFFELAGIYDRHIPDVRRAEAAYRRVLKLVPDDLPAMERLAELYRREGMRPQAVEMLEALVKTEISPDRVRAHQLALAAIFEEAGDARRAEQALETARRASPTDIETLRALAEFYGRQKAHPALTMHLNRATRDFRSALESDLADEAAWIGLVEVLGWRHRRGGAEAAASAAVALGIVDVELAKLVDARGAATACSDVLSSPEVEDAIAPAALSSGTREVFKRLGPFLDKVFALDPRGYRAERVGPKDAASRLGDEIGRWLGVSELELWAAPASPRLSSPIGAQPVAVLVGREILALPDAEQRFLLARSIFLARAGLASLLRAPLHELTAMLVYVAQQFDPEFQLIGVDPGLVHEQGRRLAKIAPKRALEELGPLVLEMAGMPGFDASTLVMAASELGDRVALVGTGAMPAALDAILKLSGLPTDMMDVASRVATLRRAPEALSLVHFAISEAHFEARQRSAQVP